MLNMDASDKQDIQFTSSTLNHYPNTVATSKEDWKNISMTASTCKL